MTGPFTHRQGVTITTASLKHAQNNQQLLDQALADYDRRAAKPWGRFLLWLLKKTT